MNAQATITAAIVDDEAHCIETLTWDLTTFCPQVEVVASFGDSSTALAELEALKPHLLFLDIEMPKLNGFDLLNRLEELQSHIIFTTAYSEYAVRAFRYSAVDYLLKPIDPEQLKQAVARVPTDTSQRSNRKSLRLLYDSLEHLHGDELPTRLSLPTADGFEVVRIDDIIRCQSDASYTDIVLLDGRTLTVSRNLKQLSETLEGHSFQRVHHSHLINFRHLTSFSRQDGGVARMVDGSEVLVSRSKRDDLLKELR